MKTIRSFTKNPLTILVMVIAFLNISCNQDEFAEIQMENVSGDELFKSIIFADGMVTKNLPSLTNYSPEKMNFSENEIESYRIHQENLINHLKSLDPNYMINFKESILSKDFKIVSNELEKVKIDVIEYYKVKLQNENISLDKLVNEYQNGEFGDVGEDGVAMWLVVSVILVIAIVIAATLSEVKGGPTPVGKLNQNSLSNEILVVEILNL